MDKKIDDVISQGVAEAIEESQLRKLLTGERTLNIKLGIDPTSSELHLGHAATLRKLRQFQDLGHQIYLIIGDITASIGDPTGVNKTRPVLTEKQIHENMKSYMAQAGKILDLDKTKVVYNSDWLKKLDIAGVISYASQISVNRLIEREDFANRLKDNNSVGLHEFLYPLVQAIDSVHLKIDIEVGGLDQKLNFLVARDVQKKLGQAPEGLILMKLLVGTDGSAKMSKSKNNFIALTESADQMFGKLMSVPDSQILTFAELAAWMNEEELGELGEKVKSDPRGAKADMAESVVARYYLDQQPRQARERFDSVFRDKKVDADLVLKVSVKDKELTLVQVITTLTKESSSQARRLVEQRGVKIDGNIAEDPYQKIDLTEKKLVQIGKHQFFELLSK